MSDVVTLNDTAITDFIANINSMTNKIKTAGRIASQSFNIINMSVRLAGDQIKDFASNKLEKLKNKLDKVKDSVQGFGSKIKSGVGSIVSSIKNKKDAIIAFAKDSVNAAQDQAKNEIALASSLKQRTNATKEQIDSILGLTSAQQENGVVSDNVQMAGAKQLSSYVANADSIKTLIPAMNNLLVSQKGLSGTESDAASVADMMGKGLKGQTEELEKSGIAFSDAQKKILQYGSEQEKTAVLAEAINKKVGEANKEMSETDVGAIAQAKILFGDLKESIGKQVLPYLAMFAKWFSENEPKIKAIINTLLSTIINTIVKAVQKIFAFIESHPEITQFVMTALEKFKEFGMYLSIVVPPILKKLAQWFTTTILPVLKQIGDSLLNLWNKVLLPFITTVFPSLKQGMVDCFSSIGVIIEGALQAFRGLIDFITGVFTGDWATAWEGVVNVFDGIFKGLAGLIAIPINAVIAVINAVIDSINSNIQINIPDWVPLFGGEHFSLTIPNIKSLDPQNGQSGDKSSKNALGTSYWKGGLTYINERGGEIVDLPNGSRVIPADKSDRLLSGNGVSFGNVYITAKGVTARQVVNEIVPQLKLQLANM